MKPNFFIKLFFLAFLIQSSKQSQLRVRQTAPISTGDRIDGRFGVLEQISLYSTIPMTERWEAADTQDGNKLVFIKFYMRLLSQNTRVDPHILGDVNPNEPQVCFRRFEHYFTDQQGDCDQMKTIQFNIPQSEELVQFDECTTQYPPQPPSPDPGFVNMNDPVQASLERNKSGWMNTPFYNIFKKPMGQALFDLCINGVCRHLFREISRNILTGLTYLITDRQSFTHGNLNVYDIYWYDNKRKIHISNMNFNKVAAIKSENSSPWMKDLSDLALVLARLLSRNENFVFDSTMLTPMDLFKEIHKKLYFPIVGVIGKQRVIQPGATWTRVTSFLQKDVFEKSSNQNQNQKAIMVDNDLDKEIRENEAQLVDIGKQQSEKVNYVSVETAQNEDDNEHVLFAESNRFKEKKYEDVEYVAKFAKERFKQIIQDNQNYDYQDVEIKKKPEVRFKSQQFGDDCADNPNTDCNNIIKGQDPCNPQNNVDCANGEEINKKVVCTSFLDVDIGVPPCYNPNDMSYSNDEKNQQLALSMYDFIYQLMGNTIIKEIKIKQFENAKEALKHPFLFITVDTSALPSDV